MTKTPTTYLSKKGIKELRRTITRLERDRQQTMNSLREVEKTDGRDERLARAEQLAALEVIQAELAEKQEVLKNAKLLPRRRDALKVAIGSVVELLDQQGRIIRYTLVESIEANPSDGRISIKSPLGQSLLGKQLKDIVEWSGSKRTNRWQLVAIS